MRRDTGGSFQAVQRPQRLSDEVATAIASRIYDGTLAQDERIPTEAQLCAEFEVSRHVVREAIARLRDDGLLISKQGLGVFVTNRASEQPFRLRVGDLSSQRQLIWIYELRMAIETAAAGLAAQHRNKVELEELELHLTKMRVEQLTPDESAAADLAFHKTVAQASHNPYYRDLMNYLAGTLIANLSIARENSLSKGVPADALREHDNILEAIRSKEPIAAERAAKNHLMRSLERLRDELES